MPSYGGAKAAIEARLRAQWTDTPIAVENGPAVTKTDGQGNLIPWVYLEVQDAGSTQLGIGAPGDQLWVYDGLIAVHVFVEVGDGTAQAAEYADRIGDIFRAAAFYNEAPGFGVRCGSPRTGDAGSGAEDGNWYRVTATVPFEYHHRG